jgi:hypothetical protein
MKRNTPTVPSPGKKAKTSKYASIFDELESKNSGFLSTAAEQTNAFQLAQTNAAAAFKSPPGKYQTQIRSYPLKFSSSQGSPGSIAKLPLDNEEAARRADRRERFLAEQQAALAASSSGVTLVEARAALGTATQGQNKNLEKEYLRLTSLPNIADVRGEEVLEQALALVQQKWKNGECSYKYACDQLKSIRQDLTVQHIKNSVTVRCYETHARLAIETGDWAELRQSLAVLSTLYVELRNTSTKKKKKRKASIDDKEATVAGLQNQSEFVAYNLMLAAATGRSVLSHELKECASRGFLDNLEQESPSLPFLRCALAACKAATTTGNFIGLLKLYYDNSPPPRMTPYLLDLLVEKSRPKAYATLLASYGDKLPFSKVAEWLGFAKRKEAVAWIRERGGVVENPEGSYGGGGKVLDIKASREGLRKYLASTSGGSGASGGGPSPPSK